MRPRAVVATATMLQIALDALLAVLVVVVVAGAVHRSDAGNLAGWVGIAAVACFVAVYAWGRVARVVTDDVAAPRGSWWPAGAWVVALVALWTVCLAAVDGALWIAFALFFVEMRALGPRRGTVLVVVTTAVAVLGGLRYGLAPVGSVVGPVLGAAVCVGVVLGLEAVLRESQERLAVISELRRTRADLASAESARARAAERERLAREIHDTLAQGFSSIGLLLHAADRALEDGDVTAVRRHLAVAEEAVGENLAEARRVVRALAPPALDASGLLAALERLAAATRAQAGLEVEVEVCGDARQLPVPLEVALLRISQSALANVVQHARATRARVTVTFHDDAVTLDVVDDGIGLDPAVRDRVADPGAPQPLERRSGAGGFGLVTMRSRAAELGGRLVVESVHGDEGAARGTAVAVLIPLGPGEAADGARGA